MYRIIIFLLFLSFCTYKLLAQDSLILKGWEDSLLNESDQRVYGTFKATQIVNMPTVETPGKNSLQFMIMHRFGRINEGGYALFGLDNATIRFALDYGVSTNFSIGIGRSSFEKVYDASVKWRILRQAKTQSPVTLGYYGMVTYNTLRYPDKSFLNSKLRTSYTSQLLVARKFSPAFSLQLTPAWLHFNLVATPQDKNDVFVIGAGGRLKMTRRVSLNAEYNLVPDGQLIANPVNNSLSFGVDIETGGHVFQLIFSNSQGMAGPYYLAKANGEWDKGDIYFGFNVTRLFHLKK